jgi:betaine-aldehyde dehydrogenase
VNHPQDLLHVKNHINGAWVASASGALLESIDPATQAVVGTAPSSTPQDTEQALQAAREAFDRGPWPYASGEERAAVLLKMGQALRDNQEHLALLITRENGRTLKNTRKEVLTCAKICEYFAAQARLLSGHSNLGVADGMSLVSYEPVGVCALITPWNFPLDLAVRKIAAALAAGCTMVLKPASLTPLCSLELVRVLASVPGLPPGVLNSLSGSGRAVGDTMVRSPLVNKISFTGESATGKAILKAAADGVKRVSMELGGKSPNIVFEDAPLEAALDGALWGTFHNTGQSCSAKSRLVVHASLHDRFVAELARRAERIRVGPGLADDSDIGPLASADQLEKVMGFVETGLQGGARRVTGGERLTDGPLGQGFFIRPAIFDRVAPDMDLAQHEIFGPVLSVLSFDTEDEAIALANATPFGLSSAIWTTDVRRAFRVSRRIRAGEVMVNTNGNRLPEAPFGGYGESGFGRELGSDGLRQYQEAKHTYINLI